MSMVLILSVSGCGSKKNDETDVQTDLEPEITESIPTTPLTPELLDGTWVDEGGFVCEFNIEENYFVDQYGTIYSLLSVNDHEISISEMYDDLMDTRYGLPVSNYMEIECTLAGDTLMISDHEAVRISSEEGQETAEKITELIAGNSFEIMGTTLVFDENMKTVSYEDMMFYPQEEEFDIDFNGARFLSEYSEMVIRLENNELIFSNMGFTFYVTDDEPDMAYRWLSYDSGSGELLLLDFTDEDYYQEEVATGEKTVLETDPPVLEVNDDTIGLYYDGTEYQSVLGWLFIDSDDIDYNEDEYAYTLAEDTDYLIRYDSVCAESLINRILTEGNDQGEITDYAVGFAEGNVSIECYENQLATDIVHISEANARVVDGPQIGQEMYSISEHWQIEVSNNYDGPIELSFDYDGEVTEDTSIFVYHSDFYDGYTKLDTTFEDGRAYCQIQGSGTYVLASAKIYVILTEDNYYDTDPLDTAWGNSDYAGDIPSLVDMEYLRQSDGYFEISTPEQLATLTYYVDTYPRDEEDDQFFVYVEILNDIDLEGYNWAPLGDDSRADYMEGHLFKGIFCGNGYVIRNLTINNGGYCSAFFGEIYSSTVVGLNLENECIYGASASLLAGSSSTTDYADCHFQGMLPSSNADTPDCVGYYTSGRNAYSDCTYSVETSCSSLNGSMDYNHELTDYNWVINMYDPERDGTYHYHPDEDQAVFSASSNNSGFTLDSDGDGVPDIIEEGPINLMDGSVIYLDPYNPDTDGDGITDGEELGMVP